MFSRLDLSANIGFHTHQVRGRSFSDSSPLAAAASSLHWPSGCRLVIVTFVFVYCAWGSGCIDRAHLALAAKREKSILLDLDWGKVQRPRDYSLTYR